MSSYTVKKVKYKGQDRWQVITPSGTVSNSYNHPTFEEAERSRKLLEAFFGEDRDVATTDVG